MSPSIASAFTFALIAVLFVRDHRNHRNLSGALWIPLVWLFLAGSRNLSGWLNLNASPSATVESYSEGNSVDRLALTALMGIAALVVARRKLPLQQTMRMNRPVVLFLAFTLASVVWSEFPFIAFKRWIKFLGVFPVILVVLSEESPEEALVALIRRCSYLLVSLSFLFVRYYPQFGRYYNRWTYEAGYSGVAGNKNELGLICLVAATVFLFELLRKRDDDRRFLVSVDTWTTAVLLLMTIYLLSIADSSTATACTAVNAGLIMATRLGLFRRAPRKVVARVLSIALVLASLQVMFDVKGAVIRALGRNPTLTERTGLWALLLGMDTNPLVGTGYESFWTEYRMAYVWSKGYGALQAHNGYIDTYLTLGGIGVALLATLVITGLKRVSSDMERAYELNQLKLAFLATFVLYNYTEAAFPRPGMLLIVFFLLLLRAPGRQENRLVVQPSKDLVAVPAAGAGPTGG